jgi:uncharacterized membrane protein YqhA
MYLLFEIIGGYVFWMLSGFKNTQESYQTNPGDMHGKRLKNRICGIIVVVAVFYFLEIKLDYLNIFHRYR